MEFKIETDQPWQMDFEKHFPSVRIQKIVLSIRQSDQH